METLVLPKQYVELQEDEMMYLDGGWGVPKQFVSWTIPAIVSSAVVALSTFTGLGSLKILLASYGMRMQFASFISAGLAKIGLAVSSGKILGFISFLAGGFAGDFASQLSDDLDRRDGNFDGWISW